MSKKNTVQNKKNSAKASKPKAKAETVKIKKKAGRPKGTGKYGCETKAMRVPTHLVPDILKFVERKIKTEKKAA